MFSFFSMMDNYEERKVDRFEKDGMIIDTCSVTDSTQPYETGIKHPQYNNGKWIIVEQYNTIEEAKEGQDKWIEIMTSKKLPKQLKDVSTCEIAQLCKVVGSKKLTFTRKSKKDIQST